MKILNKLHQISKAYIEGIYADTPANRKLGRVGMRYDEYNAKKQKEELEAKKAAQEKDKAEKIPQIKNTLTSIVNKLGKINDNINITTKEGVKIRLDRGMGKDSNGFTKAYIKKDKSIKTFELRAQEDLINSLSQYIYTSKLTIEESKISKTEVNVEENSNVIHHAMQDAIDNSKGVITIKGSGDTTIYLSRRKSSWYLKEFDSFTIRDNKKNVIAEYRLKEQEDKVISKLESELQKHGITLEGNKSEFVKKEEEKKEIKEETQEEEEVVEVKKIQRGSFAGEDLTKEQVSDYASQKAMSTSTWDLFSMSSPKLLKANYPIDVMVTVETTVIDKSSKWSLHKLNLSITIKDGSSYGSEGKETKYESICSNLANVKKKIGKSFAEHLESSPKAHEAFKKYLTQK